MGLPSLTLDLIMSLIRKAKHFGASRTSKANSTVQVFEKCAAIDGTWGLKQQYCDLSLKVAQPLLIREEDPDLTVSDCALAGLQIQQETRNKPLHPLQVLELAYGLAEDGKL